MKFSFGQKPEGPEIPEDGASDITSADIPKPREVGKSVPVDVDFEKANSEESERVIKAQLIAIEDLLQKVSNTTIGFVDKRENRVVYNQPAIELLQKDLDSKLSKIKKEFGTYLASRSSVQAVEDLKKGEDEGEAWKA